MDEVTVTIGDITFRGPSDKVAEIVKETTSTTPNNSVVYRGKVIKDMSDFHLKRAFIEILESYLGMAKPTRGIRELVNVEFPRDSYMAISEELVKRARMQLYKEIFLTI